MSETRFVSGLDTLVQMSTVQTERRGIAAVEKQIATLGGFFRELPPPDDGVDAQIEWADEKGRPNGRLLAVQVKSGVSYFKNAIEGGWRHPVNARHLEYWGKYSLPVILILYNPQEDIAYWQVVTPENLARPKPGAFTIFVPKLQVLDGSSLDALVGLANEGLPEEPAALKVALVQRRAEADFVWMELLDGGAHLFLEAEEWVNKTSGRGALRLVVEDYQGERTEREWPWVFLPGTSYAEELPKLFPWADLEVDRERFRAEMYPAFLNECAIWDSEEDDYVVFEDFDRWLDARLEGGLQPYAEMAGEVALWRLELKLNELGRETLQREREADMEEMWDAVLAADREEKEAEGIREGQYEGEYGDMSIGRSFERVVFSWDDHTEVIAAAEVLWSDEVHRLDLATAILQHALQREPSRALANAFVTRFKATFDNASQGWGLTYEELKDWLRELGTPD